MYEQGKHISRSETEPGTRRSVSTTLPVPSQQTRDVETMLI